MVRYRFSASLLIPRIPSFLFGRRRSLSADAHLAFQSIAAAPHVMGVELIPPHGAFLLVMNHFHRADIPSWWLALAVAHTIATHRAPAASRDVRMIVASQWTYPAGWRHAIVEPLSRFLVGRVIRAYDFLPMEPTALGTSHAGRRAQSVRHILTQARAAAQHGGLIGLAPEGGDTPDGKLIRPPHGVGRFMLLLAGAGLPFLPVGAYAAGDQLCVRFGTPFNLEIRGSAKVEREEQVVQLVMGKLAALLPVELRGPYEDLL